MQALLLRVDRFSTWLGQLFAWLIVALTLMIAESRPQHKDTVVKVVVNLINRDN